MTVLTLTNLVQFWPLLCKQKPAVSALFLVLKTVLRNMAVFECFVENIAVLWLSLLFCCCYNTVVNIITAYSCPH